MNRPSWDQYFSGIARMVAERSTCEFRKVGSVIVDFENRIISTGYNGTPRGTLHCYEGGCPRREAIKSGMIAHEPGSNLLFCTAIHAEINAIIQAAQLSNLPKEFKIYVTTFPCLQCLVGILNAGCREIVYLDSYSFDPSVKLHIDRLLKETGATARPFQTF
ncbi:MAG TPA: cytidine/deoxycytidylate deaminase family protein [Candidatus Hodarchaeales archaeon]|nr:cytidine/deoxycytidylate deaminase family protein [Candidatus Hodarchaeales archaeon]